jgi:microcystin-dependent protein
MFAGNFAPVGWMFCQGQLISIAENETLFTLIGTTYGGDGQSTFGLPDLRGRVPIHVGNGFPLGAQGGDETVTLSTQQVPTHNHLFNASLGPPSVASPEGAVLSQPNAAAGDLFGSDRPTLAYNPANVLPSGGSQPHSNLQPYLCISFIIALFGIFPQQS